MMKFLVRVFRRARRKYIPDNSAILPTIRRVYQFLLSHGKIFERHGIPIAIGGYGYFRLHPKLVIGTYNFEEWGTAHNAGFRQWVEACRGKHTVLDIGAHIGLYALPASGVLSEEGRIYAFEPADANRQFLMQHLAYNQIRNVEVIPNLVGDEHKQGVPFFETAAVHGMNTIVQQSVTHKSDALFRKMLRNQIRLDDFCRERGITPEVIKIDVEGGELNVFKGAREILGRVHPLIFLSVHPAHLQHLGSSVGELYGLIRDLGYRAYEVDRKEVNVLGKEEYILRHENIKT